MRSTARVILALATVALFHALVDAAGPEPTFRTARRLAYVESSVGLVPPTLDGGGTEIEMGDVDGDGRLDLVSIGDHGSPFVNSDQHGVMVWFGDGAGSWSVVMVGEFGYGGVALGDVNGDGFMDVGYGMHHNYSGTDLGDQLLEVALGDGSGSSWTPWDDGLATNGEDWGMFSTDLADVDNDGDLDVGSNSFGCCAGVHVYLNQGDGTWVQSFGFVGGNSADEIVFGDINGDGNADLAVSQQYGTVYLGDGSGGFTLDDGNLPAAGSSGRLGISLGDVNGDGREDLAFSSSAGGLEVWAWTGPGTWSELSGALPASGPWEATQLVDMNRDGHVDLCAFGSGQGRVWAGDGAGGWTEVASFTTPSPGDFEAFRAGGDVDHNGYPDLVLVADEGSWPNDRNHIHVLKESSGRDEQLSQSTPVILVVSPDEDLDVLAVLAERHALYLEPIEGSKDGRRRIHLNATVLDAADHEDGASERPGVRVGVEGRHGVDLPQTVDIDPHEGAVVERCQLVGKGEEGRARDTTRPDRERIQVEVRPVDHG
jgi:hypothetical protein